jgi:hypothetical protein
VLKTIIKEKETEELSKNFKKMNKVMKKKKKKEISKEFKKIPARRLNKE